jgi:hypothetical protein
MRKGILCCHAILLVLLSMAMKVPARGVWKAASCEPLV